MNDQVPVEAVEAATPMFLEAVSCAGKCGESDRDLYAILAAAAPFIRAQGEREHRASALEDAAWSIERGAGLLPPPNGAPHPARQWLRDRAAAEREGGADR